MKFTIDRSKWRCGGCDKIYEPGFMSGCELVENKAARGLGDTLLLNDSGFMCCLGQVGKQLVPNEYELLLNKSEPVESESLADTILTKQMTGYEEDSWINSPLASAAMSINDSWHLSDEDREKQLTDLFAKHGHEIEFIGQYVNYYQE